MCQPDVFEDVKPSRLRLKYIWWGTMLQRECLECGGPMDNAAVPACTMCGTVCDESNVVCLSEVSAPDFSDVLFRNHIGRLTISPAFDSNKCMRQVRRYNKWSECCTYRTQMLCKGFDAIERFMYNMRAPSKIISDARGLYARATDLAAFSRKHRSHMLCASIMCACVTSGTRLDEAALMHHFGVQRATSVHRICEQMRRQCCPPVATTPDGANMISAIVCKLGEADRGVQTAALELWNRLENVALGFRPSSLAAACVAFKSPKTITKKFVAKCAGVSLVTLNNCMKHLMADERIACTVGVSKR
jgi:transcription initiation factor TFIIIB Brf1 subunit/transcription initiation factor TFIIB